ncbi:MAG: hypothetical protein ACLRSW_02525 [Christensenellaceae bacterium]|jgi:hypothetical protein
MSQKSATNRLAKSRQIKVKGKQKTDEAKNDNRKKPALGNPNLKIVKPQDS